MTCVENESTLVPNARVNQPYATFMLVSALCEVFVVQLYKNNARALLLHILDILNSDWLQHVYSVQRVHEVTLNDRVIHTSRNCGRQCNISDMLSSGQQVFFSLCCTLTALYVQCQ